MTIDEFLELKVETLNKRYRSFQDIDTEIKNFSGLKRKDVLIRKKSTNSLSIYYVTVSTNGNHITVTFLKSDGTFMYPKIILVFSYFGNPFIKLKKVWYRINNNNSGSKRFDFDTPKGTLRDIISDIIVEASSKAFMI